MASEPPMELLFYHNHAIHFPDKYGFTKPPDKRPSNVKPGIRIVNGQALKVVIRVHKNEPVTMALPNF